MNGSLHKTLYLIKTRRFVREDVKLSPISRADTTHARGVGGKSKCELSVWQKKIAILLVCSCDWAINFRTKLTRFQTNANQSTIIKTVEHQLWANNPLNILWHMIGMDQYNSSDGQGGAKVFWCVPKSGEGKHKWSTLLVYTFITENLSRKRQ